MIRTSRGDPRRGCEFIESVRHNHVAEPLRDSESRDFVAASVSERLTYVINSQLRRVKLRKMRQLFIGQSLRLGRHDAAVFHGATFVGLEDGLEIVDKLEDVLTE